MLLWARTSPGPISDPYGNPARSFSQSAAKLCGFLLDYFVGYWLVIRPSLTRHSLVIFDRYFHDIEVDAKRYRYAGPRWLVHLLSHLVPTPDLFFMLSAPPTVLASRKREVVSTELLQLCIRYQQFASRLPNAIFA